MPCVPDLNRSDQMFGASAGLSIWWSFLIVSLMC